MLTYKLYKNEESFLLYLYYPQGNGDAGLVSINKQTGETAVVEASKDDFGNRFASKLMRRLKEFFSSDDYRQEGIIAWY